MRLCLKQGRGTRGLEGRKERGNVKGMLLNLHYLPSYSVDFDRVWRFFIHHDDDDDDDDDDEVLCSVVNGLHVKSIYHQPSTINHQPSTINHKPHAP